MAADRGRCHGPPGARLGHGGGDLPRCRACSPPPGAGWYADARPRPRGRCRARVTRLVEPDPRRRADLSRAAARSIRISIPALRETFARLADFRTRCTDEHASSSEPIIDDVVAGRYRRPGDWAARCARRIRRLAVADASRAPRPSWWPASTSAAGSPWSADENTWPVLGARVATRPGRGVDAIVLDHPKADEDDRRSAAGARPPRRRADRRRLRHASTTCASTSPTAPAAAAPSSRPRPRWTATSPPRSRSRRDGFKLSLPAHAPARRVLRPVGVLAAAPSRMMRAGLGDTVCRTTAQVDWLLSHLLLDTVYAETPYRLMARGRAACSTPWPHRLPEGDLGAMLALARLLILSGLGVLVTNTSHCGSMGEHAISHFIDTFAEPAPGTLHGEQVGIATWSMARLQAAMLAQAEPPVAVAPAARSGQVRARLWPLRRELPRRRCARSRSTPPAPSALNAPPRRPLAGHPRAAARGHAAGGRDRAGDACGRSAADRGRGSASTPPSTGAPSATRTRSATATAFSTSPPRPAGSRRSRPARGDARPAARAADEERSPARPPCSTCSSTDEQRRTRIAWLYYVEGMHPGRDRRAARRQPGQGGARPADLPRDRAGADPDQRPPRLLRRPGAPARDAASALKEAVVVPTPRDPDGISGHAGHGGRRLALRPAGARARPSASAGAAPCTGACARCAAATLPGPDRRLAPGRPRPRLGDQHLRDRLARRRDAGRAVLLPRRPRLRQLGRAARHAAGPGRACARSSTAPAAPISPSSASARWPRRHQPPARPARRTRRSPSSIAAGAVGDLLCTFLDADGRPVDHPLNRRVVGLPRRRPRHRPGRRPGLRRRRQGAGDPRRAGGPATSTT